MSYGNFFIRHSACLITQGIKPIKLDSQITKGDIKWLL